MIPTIIDPHNDGLPWSLPHRVRWNIDSQPTICWADRVENGACGVPGTGRLGLCREHERELLGERTPV